MRLHLIGHDYKYAVEQVLLTMFPEERPVYAVDSGQLTVDSCGAQIQLTHGTKYSTAVTDLYHEGANYRGTAKCVTPDRADKLIWDRTMQKIIKLSFYRAAKAATGQTPPWGALTGIRPGKRATALLEAGATRAQIQRIFVREYEVAPQRAALCIDTANAALVTKAGLEPLDICLYVGIPFCPTRCAYCSFVALDVEKSTRQVAPYLAALEREIETVAAVVRDLGLRPVALYIGGGTPTTLSAAQLSALTDTLARRFDLSQLKEYTVEAGRPDTLDVEKLQILRDAGVTRISVNPQSMEDAVLEAIGRKHTATDIRAAVEMTQSMGFPVLNMDLIAGLPADTPDGFARTLEQVLGFGAENITVHTLAQKRGARIKAEGVPVPGPREMEVMLDTAEALLTAAGYAPYYLYRQKFTAGGFENVGWTLPGAAGLYNIAIMEELCSILSMGAGAATKLVDPHTGRIPRTYNPKYPLEYTAGIDKILAGKEAIKKFYEEIALPAEGGESGNIVPCRN